MNKKQKNALFRIVAASAMMVALHFAQPQGAARFLLYLLPYLTVGYDILLKAGKGIARRQVFDENFLMAAATLGALTLAVTESGDYTEAIAVMLFYQIGELFQSVAVGRSRKDISALMDIRPDYANIERDGRLERVDPDEVAPGTTIVVQPGEKIPIDGIVAEGTSTLNTAALTGESAPRGVVTGSEVLSGCINMTGVLKIRTTREFSASTASKILDLVENAGSRKSRSEEFISKFARFYTPAVCCGALALAALPPLTRLFFMNVAPQWSLWIYRALIFLVISCPCALVVSIPLSFFAGIGGASRRGILVKGANFFEALAQTKCVVFDKTGTLTQGVFEVAAVHHCPIDPKKLLEYAALAESASSHPISKSLKKAYGLPLDRKRVSDIREYGGEGVTARVDGTEVAAGNAKLMERFGIAFVACRSAGSIVHMAIDGAYAGHVVISDVLKPHAKEAVAALRRAGVRKTVMLTGDRRAVAEKVARETGVDEFRAELLPADKVTEVEALLTRCGRGEKLAFVGDGINDAPVLSRADVGIAMGAMGSDAAIEAADVVLMDDDPLKIAKAIAIARRCLRIVKENIWFAIGVKAVCLLTGALGLTGMGFAIFADVGVMVLAVLNAVRALFVKNL